MPAVLVILDNGLGKCYYLLMDSLVNNTKSHSLTWHCQAYHHISGQGETRYVAPTPLLGVDHTTQRQQRVPREAQGELGLQPSLPRQRAGGAQTGYLFFANGLINVERRRHETIQELGQG